ncbi:MAG TPA: hypothetical protein VN192_02260 [Flavobacterium sp.]|jgi:hypothetical protein|nr:hypothetical protein [Flavobacterium sp.]
MKLMIDKVFILFVLIFIDTVVYAGPNPPPPAVPPPGTPIDGGICAMFVIAVMFGIYKVHQYKKYKKTPI